MIWSQNSTCIACLNTEQESHVPLYPKQLNTDQTFGDYIVKVVSEKHRLYTIERNVCVTLSETNNLSRTITILQPKQWPTKK